MTFDNAAAYAVYQDARDRFRSDPDILTAIRKVTNLEREAKKESPKNKGSSLGKLVNSVVGGVMGYTAAKAISSVMDLSPEFSTKLQTSAATTGALMGLLKSASAKDPNAAITAFRIGFLKAAMDSGYFKKTAAVGLMVDPASLLSLPRAAAEGAARVSSAVGTGIGAASAPDEVEEDLLKLQLEKQLLQQRLRSAIVNRQNRRIRDVLAKSHA